jgi:hypothetical protein
MQIQLSSGCATAHTVRGKLEQLSLFLSEFQNRQCRSKDKSRRSTTLAIAVSRLIGTFARSAGLQSFLTSQSCQVLPSSKLALWTTRPGSIPNCMSIATALSVGRPYPRAVKGSRRCPVSRGVSRHLSSLERSELPPLRNVAYWGRQWTLIPTAAVWPFCTGPGSGVELAHATKAFGRVFCHPR